MSIRNKARVRAKQPYKTQYRVANWPAYNHGLVERGSLTLWIDEQALKAWRYTGPRCRGGQVVYTDTAIACLLTLRAVFHLPLRATQGLAHSLFQLMCLALPVPNYTTLSRRAGCLSIQLPRQVRGPLHLVLDSTGLKTYGKGEWRTYKYGKGRRRSWRKLHLAVDETSGEIQAMVLSTDQLDDAAAVEDLLVQITRPIRQLSADGAYDKRKVYAWGASKGIEKFAIPPRKDARLWQTGARGNDPLHPRDQTLLWMRQIGRRKWKRRARYYRQSTAENAVYRFKSIFGPGLCSRRLARQITEARIKCMVLNRMTYLGMPDSYPVPGG